MTIVVCDKCQSKEVKKINETKTSLNYGTVLDADTLRRTSKPKKQKHCITYQCQQCGHQFVEEETYETQLLPEQVWIS